MSAPAFTFFLNRPVGIVSCSAHARVAAVYFQNSRVLPPLSAQTAAFR
jgi:hypothetical protein